MKNVETKVLNNGVFVKISDGINLGITLDCGQAFRWVKNENGLWSGVVRGVETEIEETDGGLLFHSISEDDFYGVFYDYFDFGRDYTAILKSFESDSLLKETAKHYGVIRILNQEPWEALCSFIISSCNNIPRIKSIIEKLCVNFGEKINNGYSFPSAEKIASLDISELGVLRAGYRDEFIMDASRAAAQGRIDFEKIKTLDMDSARNELMTIKGVGEKVADCAMLYGLGFIDSFPVDRHIKRIEEQFYPNGLPECINGYSGIAQQYMFHFQRTENSG